MDGIFVNWGFRGREFLLEHGFVDRIVERHEQKKVLTDLLHLHSVSAELKISSFAEKTEIENVKAAEVRAMNKADLEKKLSELKAELFNLRFQHAINQLDNPIRLNEVKKDIARVKTVLRELELKAEQ